MLGSVTNHITLVSFCGSSPCQPRRARTPQKQGTGRVLTYGATISALTPPPHPTPCPSMPSMTPSMTPCPSMPPQCPP
eukprot:4485798-Pyramimonas_sp.AAC.1